MLSSKRFEIVRCLGEGGMGVVYEARDRSTGDRVALKTLRKFSAEGLDRFKREFRALQDLHHPNLIDLGELVSEGDEWFFSMELVEGQGFLEYIGRAPPRDEELAFAETRVVELGEARRVSERPRPPRVGPAERRAPLNEARLRQGLRQLASGLGAIHAAGLVHRDIKPPNIRVTPAGRVVLLDFGLVAEVGSEGTMQRIVGTPEYMAPEQATSSAVGPEADLYSVGVLLYEALTAMTPFTGAPLEILLEKQREKPPAPRLFAPDIPADLEALCMALLQIDPRARPRANDVLQALGVSAPKASHSVASRTTDTPFIGRGAELALLREAFDAARGAQAVSVVLRGESGVGKTALVRQFLESLRHDEPELITLMGRCYERESVPYKAFDGVIDSLTRALLRFPEAERAALLPARVTQLVQVFPVLQRVKEIAALDREPARAMDPLELRSRAFAAVRDLLTRLADRRPVVVVIDDAQWSDDDSRMLLNDVLRRNDAPGLLLIATVRSGVEPAGHRSADFLSGARIVEMSGLSTDESCELARLLLQRDDPAGASDAAMIAREAAGHPLFIDALVRHQASAVRRPNRAYGLEDALWSRIEPLDALSRRVVELLAVAAAPIAQGTLAHATEIDGAELTRRVAFLRVAHLVQTAGPRGTDKIDVYHDRVRVAVLARLDAEARRHLHRRLALALAAAGDVGHAEALATHWRAAGDEEQAGKYAEVAADQAFRIMAFQRAADMYGLAVARPGSSAAEVRGLREKLGGALANAGRGALAAEAFQAAAEGAPPTAALDLRRRAAEQLLRAGHFDEGLSAMRTVVASIGMKLPATPLMAMILFALGRIYLALRGREFREREASALPPSDLARIDICWSAVTGLALIDNVRSGAFQNRHLSMALRAGEPFRVSRALCAEIGYFSRGGGATWAKTEKLIERARALAERTSRPEAIGFAYVMSGMGHYLSGKFRRGLEDYDKGHRVLRDESSGTAWEIATSQWGQLSCLAWLGELAELRRRRPIYIREAEDRGDLYGLVNLRVGVSSIATLAQDAPDEARAEVTEAMGRWSNEGFHIEHYLALVARLNVALYAGRARDAYAIAGAEWPAFQRSLLLTVQAMRLNGRWSRARCAIAAAAEVGGAEGAQLLRVAASDAAALERDRWGWSVPFATSIRAGIASVKVKNGDGARDLLARAAVEFDAVDMKLHASAVRRRLGVLVGGDEGRALVDAADVWMREQTVKDTVRLTAMIVPGFDGAR